MKKNLALGALLALALVGCSKKDEPKASGDKDDQAAVDPDLPKTVAGGCDYRTTTGLCTFNQESDPGMCAALGGTFVEGACPKDGAVPGTCLCKSDYNTEIKTYYTTSDAKHTAETAKQLCLNTQGCEWQGS